MKIALGIVFLLTAFTNYVQGQAPPADSPDASNTDPPEGNTPDVDGGANAQAGIDIDGIKCLCNLQASADTDGNAGASAGGAAECGLGDPAPTLSIDCAAILEGNVQAPFFYVMAVERNSIWGGSSWVTFDRDEGGNEITGLNFPKGLSNEQDFTITLGQLKANNDYQGRNIIFQLEDQQELSLCNNDQKPGTFEYNLVRISQEVILDGKACPIDKDTKTSVVEKPPQPLPPAIYQFPEMLLCDRLSWSVKMQDPSGRQAFQVWFDFTPMGQCKSDTPEN